MATGTGELQRTDIVGREPEVAALDAFLRREEPPRGLVLAGGPGIGKTTLWEAGVQLAPQRGLRVLSARASDAEARFSFAALGDLLDEIDADAFKGLPPPQRHALDVALLRAEPGDAPPEPHAISVGLLGVLRALAARGPVLIALDDVQWLDPSSAAALAFAARRLRDDAVVFLLTKRSASSTELEQALGPDGLERLEVGPLSFGATRRLLFERLGLTLPRHVLRRLVDVTLGNPLFALELGRTLAEHGLPAIGEEMPIPDAVEDLLGMRIARLPAPVRRLLLAVALSGDLKTSQLAGLAEWATLDEAVDAGVLVVDRDRARASHPLFAAASKKHSRPGERRELHLALAGVVADESLRARHLALAAEGPDEELATTIAKAAAAASARGSRQEAVELAERALGLTPEDSAGRSERVLALGGYLELAGERQRVTDLLSPELDSLPAGTPRARAELLLSEGAGVRSIADHERHLERALAESASDPALHAHVLAKAIQIPVTVDRIRAGEERALEVLSMTPRGPEAERMALQGLAWARALTGRPVDDVCERFRSTSDSASYISEAPEQIAGLRLAWRGHVAQARTVLTGLLELADERGEAVSYALQRVNLCDVELRAGELDAAERLLDEWGQSAARLVVVPTYERSRALLAAFRGLPDEAERWAAAAIEGGEPIGVRWQVLEALRARGLAALLAHEPERAAESLRAVWEHTRREGIDEPGAFPVAPDLVEALVELGEPDEALQVADRLQEVAKQQEHPWGLATARRCRALVQLASGQDEAAALEQAADEYGELGLRFDRARALLLLGRAQRRGKRWAAARKALELAAEAFEEIGSSGWAEDARSELGRIAARRPQEEGQLTPSEQRVAELAVEGLSNKEIAQNLVVSVHTVEAHLTHAYAKLGIRSRGQLARRLARAK